MSDEFSDEEKAYLTEVKDMLTRDLFDDNIKKDKEVFIEPIINQALQFGWDDNKIARVFSTPYSFPEIVKISGKRPDLENNGGNGGGGSNNCDCSATSYNLCWNSCGYLKNNCFVTSSGCGVLFLSQCNGQCN